MMVDQNEGETIRTRFRARIHVLPWSSTRES
jgi:hypothetical protein